MKTLVSALLCLGFLSGCGVAWQTPPKKPMNVEVITIEEQALEAVESSPTEFLVQHIDEFDSWQRAQLFFSKYLPQQKPQLEEFSSGVIRLSSPKSGKQNFRYVVEKYPTQIGYNYRVSCFSPSIPLKQQANYNARNLSRFIREGTLELSLLTP